MADALPMPPSPDMFNPGQQSLTNGMAPQIPASALQPSPKQQASAQQPASPAIPDMLKSIMDQQKKKQDAQAAVLQDPAVQAKMQDAFQAEAPMPQVPVQEYKDSLGVFKELLPALAILGGSFTKTPLMTAVKAATGAMQGFNQGQKDQAEQKMKEFNAALSEWKTKHEQVREAQGDVVDKDGNVNYGRLAAYAAAHGNTALMAALQTDPNQAAEMYMKYEKNAAELDKIHADITKTFAETDKAKAEAEKARNSANASLSDESLHRMVGQYLDGNTDILKNVGRGANATANWTAFQNALTQEMTDRGMTPEQQNQKIIDYKAKQVAQSARERTLANMSTKLDSSRNMLDESIPSLLDEAKKVGLGPTTDWNGFVNTFKSHMNDPKFANFRTQVRAVTSDYAQFIGRGTGTVHSDEEALKVLSTDMNFASIQGFADAIKTESDNTKRAMDKTQEDIENPAPKVQTTTDGWSIQKM